MTCTISRRWVVVWVCSLTNFLQLGPARLAGMLFVGAMDTYGATRGQAALPFTLCYAIRNIFGPLVGYLGNRYGLRAVSVCGCIASSIAVACCFFAEDVITFTIMWGGVYGISFGFSTCLLPQVLNKYFSKRTAAVNGIALGGDCVGGFVFPFMLDLLMKTYGMQSSLLLLGAVMMNSAPIAALLWVPEEEVKPPQTRSNKKITESTEIELSAVSATSKTAINMEHPPKTKSSYVEDCKINEKISNVDQSCMKRSSSSNSNDPYYQNTCFCDDENSVSRTLSGSVAHPYPETESNSKTFDLPKTAQNASKYSPTTEASPLKPASRSVFRVFLDPTFIIIAITQSTKIYVGIFIVTIAVDIARDAGCQPYQEPLLLMTMSICDALGRFFLGFIPDSGIMTNVQFAAVCSTLMGIFFLLPVFVSGFEMIITLLSICGLCLGGVTAVFPGICTTFVEKDQVIMALTSRYTLVAPMSLTQAPLIAFFRERHGSYKGLLVLLCVLSCICTLLCLITPWLAKRRKRNQNIEPPESDAGRQT